MARVKIGTKTYFDQLSGLSRSQIQDAIDQADSYHGRSRRSDRRMYDPIKPVAIEVKQVGGEARRIIIKPVDLTKNGLGCLIGLYFHADLECTVHLVTSDGEHISVNGRTENCTFLGNRAHFLAIKFDQHIDLDLFFPPEPSEEEEELQAVVWTASLLSRFSGLSDHPLGEDLGLILRSEAARLAGEESVLRSNELETPNRIAVVDFNGNILGVNPAWLLFAFDSGYSGPAFSTVNYLQVLETHEHSCATIPTILQSIRASINGETQEHRYAYVCQNKDNIDQYFLVRHAIEKRMNHLVLVITHMQIDSSVVDSVS